MKLIINLSKVFFPTALLILIVITFSAFTNEIYVFANVIYPKRDNGLYGMALSNYTVEYKFNNLIKRDPNVVIIGTSRVLQFRGEFFNEDSFYNAGGIISQIGHLLPLLNQMINNEVIPDTIIVGLDQNFFNAYWDLVRESDAQNYSYKLRNVPGIILPNRIVFLKAIIRNPMMLHATTVDSNNIGLLGKFFNQGFRPDGSYYFGRIYEFGEISDPDFVNTINMIENGISSFEYGELHNDRAIDELRKFLSLAQEHGINVIGFMPPYAPSINSIMNSNSNYKYITSAKSAVSEVFTYYDFEFIDFSSMPQTFDINYLDGFHGDEYVYEQIASDFSHLLS